MLRSQSATNGAVDGYVQGTRCEATGFGSRREALLAELSTLVASMLRAKIEEIDPRVPFLEMGADSLVLTQIVRAIQTTYGLKLGIRQFFEATTTIEALARHMDERLPPGQGSTSDVTNRAEPAPAPAAMSSDPENRDAPPAGATALPAAPSASLAVTASAAAAAVSSLSTMSAAVVSTPEAAPAPTPAREPRAAPSSEGIAAILGQQLQLVSQLITGQLAVLAGRVAVPLLVPLPQVRPPLPLPRAALATGAAPLPAVFSGAFSGAFSGVVPAVPPAVFSRVVPGAPARRFDARQQKHLDALVARYTQRTRLSRELAQRHRPHLADSRATVGFRFSTKEMLYPIVGQRSAGSKIWDVDGNEYVDLTMGFGVHLFGNRPPFLAEALREEIAAGVDLGPRSRLAGEVAELLCEMTGHERVVFCNSGTEAVMTAIRLARARTGRSRVAIFAGSYHGHSDATLAERKPSAGLFDSIPIAPGIPQGVASDVLVLEYGTEEALSLLRQHGATVAAVLVEPVQSRRPGLQPVEFLRELREVTERTGTALIFDEMITGFRVHPAGAQGLFGIQADLATYGKIVGGGMPIGIVAGRAAYLNGIDGGPWQYADRSYPKEEMTFFGGTFCQHPLAMAAARAVLLRLRAEGPELQRELSERTATFARAANELLGARHAPVKVEHFGSLFRFGCAGNMDLLFYHLLERGVFIWEWRCCFLSTAHTAGDTSFVLDALGSTLDELEQHGFLEDRAAVSVGSAVSVAVDSPLSAKSSPAALASRIVVASPALAASAVEPLRRVPEFVDRRRGVALHSQAAPLVGVASASARRPLEFSLSFFGKYEAAFRREKYDLLFESCHWADARGFAAVWLPERHFHAFGGLCPNPSVLASALARSTKNLCLRAGSVVLPLHNPIRVAEEWALVDNLSGGRVGVAFASGWHPDDFALAPESYGNHREITFRDLEVVRRLWRGEAVSVRGGAGNSIDVRLYPMPAQPELPTWLTIVNNPETYAKAGQLGVGVLTNLMGQTQADLARNIQLYRAALAEHGWPAEQGHVTALLHTFVAPRSELARETARRPFGDYLESSIGLFRNLMKSEKLEVDFDDLSPDDRRVLCDKAFERYLDSAILVGSPDSCETVARGLHALGVDEIAAFVDFGVDDRTVLAHLAQLSELREQCQRVTITEPPLADGAPRDGARVSEIVCARERVPLPQRGPLLPSQIQMWVLAQISPEGAASYTDMVALELTGPLELAALELALRRLVDRHEALRSCMSEDGRELVIAREVVLALPLLELQAEAVQPWLQERTRAPVDLFRAPALEVQLLRTAELRHVLVLRAHHAFVDGGSLGNLVKELGPLYGAACRGGDGDLPPVAQFGEFVRQQRELSASDRGQRDEAYWLAQLRGPLPSACLPSDRARPARLSFGGARETLRLDEALVRSVRELSLERGCTPFMTHLAVYVLWLRQLCGQTDLLVGVAVGNRPPELGEGLVGSMSQLMPLRFDEPRDLAFSDWLHSVRATLLEAFEHPDYSYASLVQKLGAGRDSSRAPLTSVVFNYDPPLELPCFDDLAVRPLPREIGYARHDLYLNVATIDGQVELECDYSTDLFDAASVRRYLLGYVHLIEQLGQDAERHLSEYTLVSADDAQRLLVLWNATERTRPDADLPVHRQIESWAKKTPNAIAVAVDADLAQGSSVAVRQLTFAELERRANSVAAALRERGVGPEDRVALLAARSPELLVGIVGILKAGAAFVPIDPAYPLERLVFMLADADVHFALTTAEHARTVAVLEVEPLLLDDPALFEDSGEAAPPLEACVAPDQLAYVMYTSGSTGRPKGVMVSHRGLADYIGWCHEVYPIADGEGVPWHGSVAFDATLTSIFAPLCSGRSVFVVPDDRDIEGLVRALGAGRRYAFVKLTPSHLALLDQLAAADGLCASTGALILGGEALTEQVLAPWRERAPELRIFNEYGPTEAVVGCALHEGSAVLPLSGAVSIGRPAADTQLYVLDERLHLVPPGVIGELHIGGTCVARGYNRSPALTAERFLPNPFAGQTPGARSGSRLYKTGDRARFHGDGSLELLGRIDDQIKIRGFRIELGEIAAVLAADPRVRSAVAVTRGQTLVAYVSSDVAEESPEGATLRAELRVRAKGMLPAHMLPSSIMILPAFPLTAHGKVDASRLPEVQRHNPEADDPVLSPRTQLEERIAAVWCELLELDRVGLHQNFFDLGGHSHLLVRAHQRLALLLGKSIPVLELFRRPTVASLAMFLSASDASPLAAPNPEQGETHARARRSAFAGLRARAERGRA